MNTHRNAVRLILAAGAFAAAAHAGTIFNFDNDSLGTSTTFTDTVNGVSATFSSPADPGGFVVYQSMFQTLTGNVLGDPGPADQNNIPLTITFSQQLSAVDLDFATADFSTPSPLTLDVYDNSQLVGSNTLTGQFLPGSTFPEGEIAFSGTPFNTLVISSTSPDFAVDNIDVVAAPEPSVSTMLGFGLVALGIPAFRRSRREGADEHV